MVFISDEQFVRWSQKVYQKCLFQRSGDQNFKKIPLGALLTQQKVRKLNLWEKTAVEKSAWIKACLPYPWKSLGPLSSPLAGSWDRRGTLFPRWWFLMVWGKSAHLCLYFQLILGKRNIFYSAGSITNWWAAAITLLLFIYLFILFILYLKLTNLQLKQI